MSKSSTATASKTSAPLTKSSAWSKGPPSASSRSQSPAPSASTPAQPPAPHLTHSRRPSALGQGVPIKDGVSIPRNNVGAVKQQGSAVTFGSIDDVSAPISSSPAVPPAIKAESVKSFGSVPAAPHQVNGKAPLSISKAASVSSASSPSVPSTPVKLGKVDIAKLFQNPSTASQPPPASSDTSSPSTRPGSLPPQSHSPSASGQPPTPSQLGSQPYTPFVPQNGLRNQPGGPGPVPRSPGFSRQQMPNGNGPRPSQGQSSQIPSGLSSPRMSPMSQPGMPPQPQPQQMPPQMAWGAPPQFYGAYPVYDPNYMAAYGTPGGWYPQPMAQHQPPQHHAPQPGQPHAGMPMSPRNPQLPLHPGTPTQAHAVPTNHTPHTHTPSASISSPPPTPSTSRGTLNTSAVTFVPSTRSKIVLKSQDGKEVNIDELRSRPPPASPAPAVPASPLPSVGSASPNRRSIRIEAPSDKAKRLAAEEEKERKAKAEAEEKERKAKEVEQRQEQERKEKEEAERKKKEEEEEEARKLKEKEEKEKQLKIEEELRKEEEERKKAAAEAEAKAKAEETAARLKLEQEEAERKKKAEEEEKERLRKEEEAAAAAAAAKAAAVTAAKEPEEGEIVEKEEEVPETPKEKAKSSLRIDTAAPAPVPKAVPKIRPGPLDLTTAKPNLGMGASPIPSALATARIIEDINRVAYPEGISSPKIELNANTKGGKFRYDRDFLLQFMKICKDKPDSLPALDAIGIEPTDQPSFAMSRGGSQRGRNGGAPSRAASVSGVGGFPGGAGAKPPFSMGQFGVKPPLTSEDRFNMTNRSVSAAAPGAAFGGRPSQMQRTASQGGVAPMGSGRTRSKRGEKRGEPNKGAPQQGHGGQSSYNYQQNLALDALGPVAPLQATANRWDRKVVGQVDNDSPELVDRKVKGLLNKLTMEKFDSISDQIIDWANKSEKEKDGRTLIQVIRLVFEKATDEATFSEMYARLCRKMMETISPRVQDDGIKNAEGKPIAGGQLFRKYLLNRCQEDFERGWVAKEATAAAAASKALEVKAAQAAAGEKDKAPGEEEVALYSDEYYAAAKAKRQGLGLIKFIGELFKLQMLTERIMHECVKKLLGNVENPEEEEIESLCKLLTTVGSSLDTPKARAHMDVYFSRMKELTKSLNVSSRMQFMLQDVIELRERKWATRTLVAAPTTIAQIHEAAAKEKAVQERESYQRQMSMSRGGSKRGGERGGDYAQVGPDGWAVAGGGSNVARPPPKAGDLSKFGKIANTGAPMTFGPASVFSGKKEGKKEAISRTNSSSNMFSMLSQNSEAAVEAAATKGSRPPSRKSSVDFGSAGAPERRKLVLAPRSKPVEETASSAPADEPDSSEEEEEEVAAGPAALTAAEAKKKVKEDIKEFYGVRNIEEAENYFVSLQASHHALLVDSLVSSALESKDADAKLVSEFFAVVRAKELCTLEAFEEGFSGVAEFLDDVAIDAPKAPQLFVVMLKGVSFESQHIARIAAKSPENSGHILS